MEYGFVELVLESKEIGLEGKEVGRWVVEGRLGGVGEVVLELEGGEGVGGSVGGGGVDVEL